MTETMLNSLKKQIEEIESYFREENNNTTIYIKKINILKTAKQFAEEFLQRFEDWKENGGCDLCEKDFDEDIEELKQIIKYCEEKL